MIINDYINLEKKAYETEMHKNYTSCMNMFRYLYGLGILRKTAFLTYDKKEDGGTFFFVLDTKDLLPYQELIRNAPVENRELAYNRIFEADGYKSSVSPYSGAVTLTIPMRTYRDNCGCIGSSYETYDEQALELKALTVISKVKEKYGAKEAVKALWSYTGDGDLSFECNMTDDFKSALCIDEFGTAYAWYGKDQSVGVEYNYCVEREKVAPAILVEKSNSSAIYLMLYDPGKDDMYTDTSNYVHYEVDFSNKDWELDLKSEMYLLLLQYVYRIQNDFTLECPCGEKSSESPSGSKKYVLTEEMKRDRQKCGEDSDYDDCSCCIAPDDCIFNHLSKDEISSDLPKVLFRYDKEYPWEHLVVFKNNSCISDGIESKSLSALDVLTELERLGIIELEKEEITGEDYNDRH